MSLLQNSSFQFIHLLPHSQNSKPKFWDMIYEMSLLENSSFQFTPPPPPPKKTVNQSSGLCFMKCHFYKILVSSSKLKFWVMINEMSLLQNSSFQFMPLPPPPKKKTVNPNSALQFMKFTFTKFWFLVYPSKFKLSVSSLHTTLHPKQ